MCNGLAGSCHALEYALPAALSSCSIERSTLYNTARGPRPGISLEHLQAQPPQTIIRIAAWEVMPAYS